ncbi:uncharacterized protein LOC124944772 isoform X2 [Impatiens glandulifera]|uniref:uncharacterized protein LOC124944772 isoform X2 n=1 Tax=Impatiens glandulifera TaxID=253017 RepID=UPI001FB154E0|nr:uncharacterized protein LOC124944772 isoform X2 [Impatiens glandulifera]
MQVCHVLIFIQEGSRFDTQILKKFRVLQAAKQSMAPFSRSRTPTTTSSSRPSSSSRSSSSATANRNSSAVSLMSGLGSYTSLFPGQCTPVILFVYLDELLDTNIDDSQDSSNSNSNSNSSSLRSTGTVVVLARPTTKSDNGFRKKLQSSLEAQIRFSIKKCRTLSSSETRNGVPLFSLDASKAVALLDRSSNMICESLDFATNLVENVLNGKATTDSLLFESVSDQREKKEDYISVKEFIQRQIDILRGRGGLVSNSNSGSAVAVAAAAAAASVASGKTFNTPELPTIAIWLTSSQNILGSILYPKGVSLSCLESSKGINTKFSISWCKRVLPMAKEVYLSELPDCYPTQQHESHMEKALRTFCSMVKGPAVNLYKKKLEEECTLIWKSGRQLCDAISLTGKPCIHQRHKVQTEGVITSDGGKPHSTGFFFLQACACGRSRQLQFDPFDFEAANSYFADCDKALPSIRLPHVRSSGPIKSSSWSLIRVGGARYYDPSQGLFQSGLSATHKFLSKWTIFSEKVKTTAVEQNSQEVFKTEQQVKEDFRSRNDVPSLPEKKSDDKKILFNGGFPGFTMRKAFSEVVAGPGAANSGFPPLQSRNQIPVVSNREVKQQGGSSIELVHEAVRSQSSQKLEEATKSVHGIVKGFEDGSNPLLQIGSNVVPFTMNDSEMIKTTSSIKNFSVYVGFEYECPRGHRFFVNEDHLSELGSTHSSPEESQFSSKQGNNGGVKAHRRSNGRNVVGKGRNTDNVEEMPTTNFAIHEKERNQLVVITEDLMCHCDSAYSLLNRDLPIYMNCPNCRISTNKKDQPKMNFAGKISQLRRIFLVTPPFPIVLATCPIIEFESSSLPTSVLNHEEKLQFSIGCQVILPPDSFLSLRLPFVYGVQLEDGSLQPLRPFDNQPEKTAWIAKGTTLQVVPK